MKSIKVTPLPDPLNREKRQFKVISTKNTITYLPDEILAETTVELLCNNPRWDVTIVPFVGAK